MKNHTPRPYGAPWIIPYMTVQHPEQIIAFYQRAFQFELVEVSRDELTNLILHAEMQHQKQLFMMGKQGAWGFSTKSPASSGVESAIGLYAYVDNVDAFYVHAVENGAKLLAEPMDMFWGDRMCRLEDPEGYVWSFATCLDPHGYAASQKEEKISVHVKITAKPGKVENLIDAYEQVYAETRKELGCEYSELIQNFENPMLITLVEKFSNYQAFKQHMQLPRLREFIDHHAEKLTDNIHVSFHVTRIDCIGSRSMMDVRTLPFYDDLQDR